MEVEGALFSIGDGHAAQGDGEVCGTAVETPMKVTVRLTVVQDTPYVQTPHFATPSAGSPAVSGGCYCTTGVDPDIREATRAAVRGMIAYLGATHGLSRTDASRAICGCTRWCVARPPCAWRADSRCRATGVYLRDLEVVRVSKQDDDRTKIKR